MITSFLGINLYTDSTQELAEFYQMKLGLPCTFEGYRGLDGARFGFKGESQLIAWDSNRWGEAKGKRMLVFLCDNLVSTYTELTARGLQPEPPFTAAWGGREMYLQDPLGNTILLLEE